MAERVWFITGASSGFGRALTELVLANGDIAVATLRKPSALDDLKTRYSSDKLLVLQLDVTIPAEITAAFAQAGEVFGRIDVVFNNAGYGVLAEAEGTPEDAARAMFDVNFWGMSNVSREAVSFFRSINPPGTGGRLLNVSSIAALKPSPTVAYYSATKAAVEGFTKSLALELDPSWNIKVVLIEFGSFFTKGRDNTVSFPAHPAYTNPASIPAKVRAVMGNPHLKRPPADQAAKKVYELAALSDPPIRFPVGKDMIVAIREEISRLTSAIETFESWSEDVGVN